MRTKVKLVSEEGTGYYYTTTKNPKTTTGKLRFRKYDPKASRGEGEEGRGKHVWFKEAKIK